MQKVSFIFKICFVFVMGFNAIAVPTPVLAVGTCGTGTWTAGNLEIHHLNIGQGDATLIVGPTGKSLLFDAGETNWNSSARAQIVGPYIEGVLGCKSLDYVVMSHFQADHIGYVGYGGLWHLVEVQGFTVGTTLVRNYNTHLGDVSGTFTNWKAYLEGAGQTKFHPAFAIEGMGQVDLGAGVAFNIVIVHGNEAIIAGDFSGDANPPSENDYSIGAVISYGNFDEWIGGDLSGHYTSSGFGYSYHDIELSAAREIGDVDVYNVNHHGSSHSSNATFINQIDPEVSIVSVGNGNTYGHPAQVTMDRLLATSAVYMTERGDTNTTIGSAIVAGHIVIKTSNGSTYTVNDTAFTATEPIRSDVDGDGYFAEVDPDDSNSSMIPSPNGGYDPTYQTNSVSCSVIARQVLINEILPAPANASDPEWVELYNTTDSAVDIGNCYIDDIVAGSPAYKIPASTIIPAHGFWTLDRITYFNNTGDEVRFLREDGSTVLDIFSYGSTGSNLSWYRLPDGGTWAASPTALTTKGQSNHSAIPGEATLISPTGGIGSHTPTYTWNQVNTATWYYLWVNGPSGNVLQQWSTAEQANCNGSTCSLTPSTTLGAGTHTWWIQTWNSVGYGPWSDGKNFTVSIPLPGQADLVSPSGGIGTNNPTYTWNEVSGTTWYYLWVNGPSGNAIKQWYTSAQANCNGSTCSVTPATILVAGSHTWWIQTWNNAGYGPWSDGMNFSTPPPPGKATLVSPTGSIASNNPTYTWNEVSGATWYFLWVSGPSGNVIKQWYTSAQANCDGSTCSISPNISLNGGAHTWWIQTWNSAGYGPWSDRMDFSIP